MIKFNEQEKIDSVNGALALRSQINEIVDELSKDYKNICWLGIGGTWASSMQACVHMKEYTNIEVFVENAAEYLTTGNKRIGQGTIVIVSSVTGSTIEMVHAVKKVQEAGAKVLGFIDVDTTELAKMVDYEIAYAANEQLKFFMVADRFMYNAGEIDWYDRLYKELEENLAQVLVDVEKESDEFALEYAKKHHDDDLHYFVGAGNQWGATYSYAMCYWEEQHWIKTKSITAPEFFHGMLEVVERDTPVTIYIGEDAQRSLSKRVIDFIPKICSNYTVIDTADYKLEGISQEFRGMIPHLVMHAVNNRIDIHIENINCHPMEIRRYYRRLDY